MRVIIERAKTENFRIDREYDANTKIYYYIIEPRANRFNVSSIVKLIEELQAIENVCLYADRKKGNK